MNIAAPLSGNTFLSSLTIENGTLAPAFSKTVVAYDASVPFSVEKLVVKAASEDATSKVSIDSPDLAPGDTTDVTVTVTAQSGAKKAYVIKVARAQDPNYKAGSNADLKSLVPNQGMLSPLFSPDVTDYVIYLPFEVTSFHATAEMADAKAQAVSGTEIQLEVGGNEFTMTGKAEDGTEKVYTILVNRMPEPGTSPTPEATPTIIPTGFQIAISGILTDAQGNPLADIIVELHSDPQITTTDKNGFYEFKNVLEGSHTLFVKEKDGTEIAQLSMVITQGDRTSQDGNTITVAGNTTLDLSLKNGVLVLKNVLATGTAGNPYVSSGVPIYLVVILVLC
jgi:hypothetical protein